MAIEKHKQDLVKLDELTEQRKQDGQLEIEIDVHQGIRTILDFIQEKYDEKDYGPFCLMVGMEVNKLLDTLYSPHGYSLDGDITIRQRIESIHSVSSIVFCDLIGPYEMMIFNPEKVKMIKGLPDAESNITKQTCIQRDNRNIGRSGSTR